MTLFEVRSRALGEPDGAAVPPVRLEAAADGGTLTVREIIRRAVAAQLAAAGGAPRARESVARQFRGGPGQGRVAGGASPGTASAEPAGTRGAGAAAAVCGSADDEAERALRAFRGGLIAVFAGGRRLESLDEPVAVRQGDRITFLRITALVGG